MTSLQQSTAPSQDLDQYLSFDLGSDLGDYNLLLPTLQLIEVLTLPYAQITPIPDSPGFVMGVCNWRGEVVWLIDLASKLGFAPLHRQGYSQMTCPVILLQINNMILALAVKKIGQMLRLDRSRISALPATLVSSQLAGFLMGYWLAEQGKTYLLLDSQRLVASYG